MISIIAPMLNEKKYIKKFLESLKNQSFLDFELIIIDGGSSDGSRDIVDSYGPEFKITGLFNEKRNLGYIRNYGSKMARGEILLFTNSDAVFSMFFLDKIAIRFQDPDLGALSGPTIPLEAGPVTELAYFCFDCLRWIFSKAGRFSPSGNFLAIHRDLFLTAGGFPEVPINEDGLLGQKISWILKTFCGYALFDFTIPAAHYIKKKRSGIKTLIFYAYVFGNFSGFLRWLLDPILRKRILEFNKK